MWPDRDHRPIVFGGPSLDLVTEDARRRLDIRPPARRGDLDRLRESGEPPRTVLLLDGVFGLSLAVTPTECRKLIDSGWTVCGAASMGALRAAELWSIGMIGIGEVFTLLRLETVTADDEVAVAYDLDEKRELTASLVHVRALLARHEPSAAVDALAVARSIHWAERTWRRLAAEWTARGIASALVREVVSAAGDDGMHPKLRDGRLAVASVLASTWIQQPHHAEEV